MNSHEVCGEGEGRGEFGFLKLDRKWYILTARPSASRIRFVSRPEQSVLFVSYNAHNERRPG